MATTTTMLGLRSTLVTALDGATGLEAVKVFYANPVEAPPEEMIFLSGTGSTNIEEHAIHSGRRRREETYDTTVVIVVQSRSAADVNETRAGAILAAVENVIVADPATNTLITNTGVIAAWLTQSTIKTTVAGSDGPVTQIEIVITATARLT